MTNSRKPRRMARDPQPHVAEAAATACNADDASARDSTNPPELKPARMTKQSLLIDMLGREGGASLAAIVEATGWLPHSARAALTGLRTKGHAIERFRSDDETTYRIVAAPAAVSIDGAITVDGATGVAEAGIDPNAVVGVNGEIPA